MFNYLYKLVGNGEQQVTGDEGRVSKSGQQVVGGGSKKVASDC